MNDEHRADALFGLPKLPRTAVLLGDPPGWPEGLRTRGIEVLAPGGPGAPELAVATASHAGEALASGAAQVIVDGSRGAHRELRRLGFRSHRLLSLPVRGSPLLYVNLDHRRAARYGIRHGIVHPERWRTARNELAASLAGFGLLPAGDHEVALGSRTADPPAMFSVARLLGVEGERRWLLLVSPGSVVRRDAFLLFAPGSSTPEWALKFSRLPGFDVQFVREERGFAVVAAAGGSVAAHAAGYRGRAEVDGRHASLETAATGTKLSALLRRPVAREEKVGMVERVLAWSVMVAKETATPPEGLDEERVFLAREVVPHWTGRGIDAGLVDAVPPIPATFLHNDLIEENVVMRRNGFTLIDWEWAQPRGLPLVDVLNFGAAALRIVDGVETEDGKDRHFVDLMTGVAPSSPVLFRWVRATVDALGLPAGSVGAIATLGWAKRGMISERETVRSDATVGAAHAIPFIERAVKAWLTHPALGPGWERWRA